jgi:hypothetical protein
LRHIEETTRLQTNKQTNKQVGRIARSMILARIGKQKDKKTRVADNYRILENTTTTKKKQECVQNPAPPFINSQTNEYLHKPVLNRHRKKKTKKNSNQILFKKKTPPHRGTLCKATLRLQTSGKQNSTQSELRPLFFFFLCFILCFLFVLLLSPWFVFEVFFSSLKKKN